MTMRREIDIERLLHWAFASECARIERDEIGATSGGARRGVGIEAKIAAAGVLGCRVDTFPGRSAPARDAEIVASIVAHALPFDAALWVAELSRARRRPDPMIGAVPRLVPVEWCVNRHGRHARTRDASELGVEGWPPVTRRNRRGNVVTEPVVYCPCDVTPSHGKIGAARQAYLAWYGHLLTLRVAIQGAGLERFTLSHDMPPMRPWRYVVESREKLFG
ncbi:MAG: hypothetical protein VXY73_07350 [Pseudomonadota bacterium]|nr:hypothetical protein [Pseudomonadota bacterium]